MEALGTRPAQQRHKELLIICTTWSSACTHSPARHSLFAGNVLGLLSTSTPPHWRCDCGTLLSSPLTHAFTVLCSVSYCEGKKLTPTGSQLPGIRKLPYHGTGNAPGLLMRE